MQVLMFYCFIAFLFSCYFFCFCSFVFFSGDSSCRFVFLVFFLLKSTFSVLHGVIMLYLVGLCWFYQLSDFIDFRNARSRMTSLFWVVFFFTSFFLNKKSNISIGDQFMEFHLGWNWRYFFWALVMFGEIPCVFFIASSWTVCPIGHVWGYISQHFFPKEHDPYAPWCWYIYLQN